MGPRTSLDGCGKSRFPLRFDPPTVQSVANRYTDCAIPYLLKTPFNIQRLCKSGSSKEASLLEFLFFTKISLQFVICQTLFAPSISYSLILRYAKVF